MARAALARCRAVTRVPCYRERKVDYMNASGNGVAQGCASGQFRMRKACYCGSFDGFITETGAQDVVRCLRCNKWQYNAPRTETGKRARSTSTVHAAIKPKRRAAILERATGRCELCGKRPESSALHVGHLVSVGAGLANGLTDQELNDPENLAAFCDECNLGMGKQTVPLRLAIALVMARLRQGE